MNTKTIIINPRVIEHLGKDLITSPDVAVLELVKNSLDAKADDIKLKLFDSLDQALECNHMQSGFSNEFDELLRPYKSKSVFAIEDNGYGMNEQQLTEGFLMVGTDIKEKTEVEDDLLGQKGIGRLATQRLGVALFLETVSQESVSERNYLFFNWAKIIAGDNNIPSETASNDSSPYTRLWILGADIDDYIEMGSQLTLMDDYSLLQVNDSLKTALNFVISPFMGNREASPKISLHYNAHEIDFSFPRHMLSLAESRHYFRLGEAAPVGVSQGGDLEPYLAYGLVL